MCALEEELKKREAELDAQSDKPPSKLKKRPNPLNSEARKLFEEHYQAIFFVQLLLERKRCGKYVFFAQEIEISTGEEEFTD